MTSPPQQEQVAATDSSNLVVSAIETMDFSMPSYDGEASSSAPKSMDIPSFNPFGGGGESTSSRPTETDLEKEAVKKAEESRAAEKARKKEEAEAKKAEEKAEKERKAAEKAERRRAEKEKQRLAVESAMERAAAKQAAPVVVVPEPEPEPAVVEEKEEAPKFEAPKFEAPKFDAPKFEAPKFEAPSLPKFDAPKFDAPKFDAPKFEAPKFEAPKFEAPETPSIELPKVEAPKFEAPALPSLPSFGGGGGETSSESEYDENGEFIEPQEVRDDRAKEARSVFLDADNDAKVRSCMPGFSLPPNVAQTTQILTPRCYRKLRSRQRRLGILPTPKNRLPRNSRMKHARHAGVASSSASVL